MATIASVAWYHPKVIHDILNLCTDTKVHICPACTKREKDACPSRGNEPVGICEDYVFAEHDPDVEARVHEHLLANAERIAVKSCIPQPSKPRTPEAGHKPVAAGKPQLALFHS